MRRLVVGIRFSCGAYARAALALDGKAYTARCPRCLAAVRIPVGPGGRGDRFFTADCRRARHVVG